MCKVSRHAKMVIRLPAMKDEAGVEGVRIWAWARLLLLNAPAPTRNAPASGKAMVPAPDDIEDEADPFADE